MESTGKHITIAVAGHVDHGKTALVRALTGIETDRLKEEQERGMSIVLGFAHLDLPAGRVDVSQADAPSRHVDFIDVPGHERFIKTMISGATGVDAALLVVAANERIKPQTVEHVELLQLLGVQRGIVAVTKCDLLDDRPHVLGEGPRPPSPQSWGNRTGVVERVAIEAELHDFMAGTFLRDAPVVFTSAVTGEGMGELVVEIGRLLLDDCEAARGGGWFYLPVDRVFTIAGHGTVVTGTLRRGPVGVGEAVEVVPSGCRAGVRGIEVHGNAAGASEPGWRTAVNLRGVQKDEIARGDALAAPGYLLPTRRVDAELSVLKRASRPIRRGQNILLYYATTEVMARVYPLDRDAIGPGETGYVQFRVGEDIAVPAGEPFVIRAYSPVETVGGGRIVDPYPHGHTRRDEVELSRLSRLAHGTVAEKIVAKVEEAGIAGVEMKRLAMDVGVMPEAPLGPLLGEALLVVECGALLVHRIEMDRLCGTAMSLIREYHAEHRLSPGIPREELRRRIDPRLTAAVFEGVLDRLTHDCLAEAAGGVVRAMGYSPEAMLTEIELRIRVEIEAGFLAGGLRPPSVKDVVGSDRRKRGVFQYLIDSGILLTDEQPWTPSSIVFHRDAVDAAGRVLAELFADGGSATVSEIDAALDTSRKYAIPLLEHLDRIGVTARWGDVRVRGPMI